MRKASEVDELTPTEILLNCRSTISVSFAQFAQFVQIVRIADESVPKEEPGSENAESVAGIMSGRA